MAQALDASVGVDDLMISVDGSRTLSAELVAEMSALCDRAEGLGEDARVIVHVSGAPDLAWSDGLTVELVSKWERTLRRLERLPATTIAIAAGACGGPALDALLATDYRIVAATLRLIVSVRAGAVWPGMALYRVARQGSSAAAIRRALLFGVPIDMGDALALHLVHEVTDDVPSALAAADRLSKAVAGSELAIRRQLMLDASTVSFEEALGAHLAACDRVLRRTSTWTTQ